MAEKKLFTRQTSRPTAKDKDGKYYTRKGKDGGISPCIVGKPAVWANSTLANCVGYAWGRFASLEANENCRVGCAKGNTYPGNASSWITYSKAQGYEVGKTPKLGAVAVWAKAGSAGHVAIVEHVNKDNSWESSESGYNCTAIWWTRKFKANSFRSGYTFLGFVYPKYEFVEEMPTPTPTPKFKVGDEVIVNGYLYKSSNATKASGVVKEKKTKITRYAEGAIHPYNTTGDLGWMSEVDIRLANTPQPEPELKVGDLIMIMSPGNSRPWGTGKTSYGIKYKRYILKIWNGEPFPYQVGNAKGVTTGYYKAEALKKI